VESHSEDLSYATFRLISWNEILGTYKATDEEYLLEVVDHIKMALLKDLRDMPNRPPCVDYRTSCPGYIKAVAETADKYKSVNSGFRRILLIPSFVLALVMASRLRKHFIHSSWFRTSNLIKMVDVHAGVRANPSSSTLPQKLTGEPAQFISEFITEGVEMLERIANPIEPPELDLNTIFAWRNRFDPLTSEDFTKQLTPMHRAFLSGQGNLNAWKPEVLTAIDEAFVANFMNDRKPFPGLFSLILDAEVKTRFLTYWNAVDDILANYPNKAPRYACHYFAFYSICYVQCWKFPMPLMAASVVECLHIITSNVREGMVKVSLITLSPSRIPRPVPTSHADLSAGHQLGGHLGLLGPQDQHERLHRTRPVRRHDHFHTKRTRHKKESLQTWEQGKPLTSPRPQSLPSPPDIHQ
jgi:hypothetical protein